MTGDYAIGSKVFPGLAKLVEEMGELNQVLGHIVQCNGYTHWTGDLKPKLIEELADVGAALSFFCYLNDLNTAVFYERVKAKIRHFNK